MEIDKLKLKAGKIWHSVDEVPEYYKMIILVFDRHVCYPILEADKSFFKKLKDIESGLLSKDGTSINAYYGSVANHKKHGDIFIEEVLINAECSIVKNKLWNKWTNIQNFSKIATEKSKWAYLDELIKVTSEY